MILDISEKSKKINKTPLSFLCPGPGTTLNLEPRYPPGNRQVIKFLKNIR